MLRASIQPLRDDKDALPKLLENEGAATALTNAIVDAVHLLSHDDADLLSRALFALLPSSTSPSPPPEGKAFDVLAQIQLQNRRSPTYGGFFLPFLELLVRVSAPPFREECRETLLQMIFSKDGHKRQIERRHFAAASLAGIAGFRRYLQEYARRSTSWTPSAQDVPET